MPRDCRLYLTALQAAPAADTGSKKPSLSNSISNGPSTISRSLRSAISGKICLAHEYVGHMQRVGNLNDLGILRIVEADGLQGRFQHFAIGVESHRNGRRRRMSARECIDSSDVNVHLLDRATIREFGQPDSAGIAVRLLRQSADENAFAADIVPPFIRISDELPTDDVRVHA